MSEDPLPTDRREVPNPDRWSDLSVRVTSGIAMVAIGTNIDTVTEMAGFNLHMNVGSGMAALIAGATIASLPFATEIVTKVSLVKDFFITLFFVGLGITMPAITRLVAVPISVQVPPSIDA